MWINGTRANAANSTKHVTLYICDHFISIVCKRERKEIPGNRVKRTAPRMKHIRPSTREQTMLQDISTANALGHGKYLSLSTKPTEKKKEKGIDTPHKRNHRSSN